MSLRDAILEYVHRHGWMVVDTGYATRYGIIEAAALDPETKRLHLFGENNRLPHTSISVHHANSKTLVGAEI